MHFLADKRSLPWAMGWLVIAWVTKGVFAQLLPGSRSSAVLAETCLAKNVFNLCHINHGHGALFCQGMNGISGQPTEPCTQWSRMYLQG